MVYMHVRACACGRRNSAVVKVIRGATFVYTHVYAHVYTHIYTWYPETSVYMSMAQLSWVIRGAVINSTITSTIIHNNNA